ncbi:MAG: FAD-dependent oxidoreductase [Deltaproteobacteria bacterium]|nr:FAD-dependent oxidoreductase [Deltaproteobacteria bacterium]
MSYSAPALILGGGLTGLSAAWRLGGGSITLERADRPGGLVRAEEIDGYWFDHVIHLLHLRSPEVEVALRDLLGEVLAPCPPEAWVVTDAGEARFPLQTHLGTLAPEVVERVLDELARLAYGPAEAGGRSYRDLLLASFGQTLFGLFFEPYNQKMWRRPLDQLAPGGFVWNLERPDLPAVLAGALRPQRVQPTYNSHAWYPRPAAGASVRGMEVLAAGIAARAGDVRLGREVLSVDPQERLVVAEGPDGPERYRWEDACLCTLPLPAAIAMVRGVPASLAREVARLRHNLVLSVGVRVRGPRPQLGHWRYYADSSLIFTRLVFLHAFDPSLAPPDGWPLLVEVPWPAEQPWGGEEALIARVLEDVARAGVLPEGSAVLGATVIVADPAYVAFAEGDAEIVAEALGFLQERGITGLGRYGRWEYSAMEGAIRDGWAWADASLGARG